MKEQALKKLVQVKDWFVERPKLMVIIGFVIIVVVALALSM